VVDHTRSTCSISQPLRLQPQEVFDAVRLKANRRDVSIYLIEGPCFIVGVETDARQEFYGYSKGPELLYR
jgi:hypothetical protein